MPGIADLFASFRSPPAQAATAAAVPNQQQQPTPAQQQTQINNPGAGEGATGSKTPQQQADEANKSPLAEFTGLWDTPTVKDGETALPDWSNPDSLMPNLSIDPAKIVEQAKKIDFSRAIDPALVTKALAGDAVSFNQVINSVQQAAFAQTGMIASKITENAFKTMLPKLVNDALPAMFKKHAVSSTVVADNPIFADPAVAPVLKGLEAQLQLKNPEKSPKEISDLAKKYINGMITAAGGVVPDANSTAAANVNKGGRPAAKEMDWLNDFVENSS